MCSDYERRDRLRVQTRRSNTLGAKNTKQTKAVLSINNALILVTKRSSRRLQTPQPILKRTINIHMCRSVKTYFSCGHLGRTVFERCAREFERNHIIDKDFTLTHPLMCAECERKARLQERKPQEASRGSKA